MSSISVETLSLDRRSRSLVAFSLTETKPSEKSGRAFESIINPYMVESELQALLLFQYKVPALLDNISTKIGVFASSVSASSAIRGS